MSQFVEVKAADLVGAALDWAVAMVGGESIIIHFPNQRRFDARGGIHCSSDGCTIGPRKSGGDTEEWSPSTNWAQGGPLIDEYGIEFKWVTDASIEAYSYTMSENIALGGTHLEAACRLIAMELGDVVQVPAELIEVI